ncbi:hypothetical protein PS910_03910 [Pseudomonas fluorescens]|nr:hypothetical protein PS910_03910 [Pseudomonas fluorescens]
MSKDSKIEHINDIKTPGIASCGEGEGSPTRLFRVMTGVPIDYALEQASVLMNCVHRMTFVGVMEKDDTLVWAAHVLAGQSRALIEDVRLGIGHSLDDRSRARRAGVDLVPGT